MTMSEAGGLVYPVGVVKYSGVLPVSSELLVTFEPKPERHVEDADMWRERWRRSIDPMLEFLIGRCAVAPWETFQSPELPAVDLFPRLTRWERRARWLRGRVSDVVHVARHGLGGDDEEYDWDE